MPPLKERREDIALLITFFLKTDCRWGRNGRIETDARQILLDYDYPGNIRELRSIIRSAANLAQDQTISVHTLPDYLRTRKVTPRKLYIPDSESMTSLAAVEKAHILKIYRQMGKNKTRTAKVLGIAMNTLWRKLKAFGVD